MLLTTGVSIYGQSESNPTTTIDQSNNNLFLIKNVRIFDGLSDNLTEITSVLVNGNKIAQINPLISEPQAKVIDAKGMTMTPGFIDIHAHVMLQLTPVEGFRADQMYYALNAAKMAEIYLSLGYTTIRDMGGNTFSLKMAIDNGMFNGPRIYPSGPMISQSSGHADHRSPNEPSTLIGGQPDLFVKYGHQLVVDGVPDVLKAVRDTLRLGASQIKIATSGGVGSEFDPLDVVQFTPEEIRAAVQAAKDWNTYVSTHAYNPESIQRAINAGVKVIEHGNLLDEPTLQLMKDKEIWLSPQVFVFKDKPVGFTEDQYKKHSQAYNGIDNMFTIAKKIGFEKIGFGTDIITDPKLLKRANEEFVLRTEWFTPAEIMHQATFNNAQILAMSGPRNPYPGTLGVIQEGALADLLLIDGNPLSDISILTDPHKNIKLIMKDGKIYKNTLNPNEVSSD